MSQPGTQALHPLPRGTQREGEAHAAGSQVPLHAWHCPATHACWVGQSASLVQVVQPSSTAPLQLSSIPLPQISAALGLAAALLSSQSPPCWSPTVAPGQNPSPSLSQDGTHREQFRP